MEAHACLGSHLLAAHHPQLGPRKQREELRRDDLNEFVALYFAANRHQRKATRSAENPDGRWRAYSYDELIELIARDKASLDIFWLKDDALAGSDNFPAPSVIGMEIMEDLQAALEEFKMIAAELGAQVKVEGAA